MSDTFLITGATQGIGLATAKMLIADGHTVVGIARQAREEFTGPLFTADLADREATAAVLDDITANFEFDGIVNCAGLNTPELLGNVDLDHLQQVFEVNVRATVQCSQALLPGMISRSHGRIVNVSSRGALGRPKRTSYGAAKAGIVGMTRTWALELADKGITANVVSPGATETEMFRRNNLIGPEAEENRRRFTADIPMGRFGQPSEIAVAIRFFLDRRSSFITGQLLHICGGSSVGSIPL
ncbi:MAG: 3-oxoacyl-[acyl-carrier protein] reductase [Alphaproteobacteria bacterium]|jgi:3-oxoacyl-[acyl-carrier protein] reductase